MLIEVPCKLGCIQNPREDFFRVRPSQHPAQHVLGAMSPVLACAMGDMMLAVVIGPPFFVLTQHLRPVACIGKSVVREPALDREQSFCIILPGLTGLNPFLANTEHVIELPCCIGIEDTATIGHDSFWRTVATNSINQNGKVVPLVPCWGDGGGKHHP